MARAVAGAAGARFVALLIVVSSLGFLAVVILTGPRLYLRDGGRRPVLRARAARLHPRYQTPVFALWFQAAVSLALLTTNTYDQLLSYVVFADWLFFGLTAGALVIVRRREPGAAGGGHRGGARPSVDDAGCSSSWRPASSSNSFVAYPTQSLIGSAILVVAAVVFLRQHGQARGLRPRARPPVDSMKFPELAYISLGEVAAAGGDQPRAQRDRSLPGVAARAEGQRISSRRCR